MAGCAKADRQRKSAGNITYIATKKLEINRKRKALRTVEHNRSIATKGGNVPHGTARALRRSKVVWGGTHTENRELWKNEQKKNPVALSA